MSNSNNTNSHNIGVNETDPSHAPNGEYAIIQDGDMTNKETVNWCFTLNNPNSPLDYTQVDVVKLHLEKYMKIEIRILIYQIERGMQGTTHLQGMFKTKQKYRYPAMKNKARAKNIGMWIAPVIDWKAMAKYCTKEESRVSGPYLYGTTLENIGDHVQGKRTDLTTVVEMIKSGNQIREIVEKCTGQFIKHSSGILKAHNILATKKRNKMTELYIFWGPTGTGKSHKAHEIGKHFGEPFYPNLPTTIGTTSPMWWDGYSGEQVVIFDEFYGQIRMQEMLKLVDKYPHKVQTKGGMTEFTSEIIIITSNKPWNEWWDNATYNTHFEAFKRRITKCEHLTEKYNGNELFCAEDTDELVTSLGDVRSNVEPGIDNNNTPVEPVREPQYPQDYPPDDMLYNPSSIELDAIEERHMQMWRERNAAKEKATQDFLKSFNEQ